MANLKETIIKRLDDEENELYQNGGDCSYAYGIEDAMKRSKIVIEEEITDFQNQILDEFILFLKEKISEPENGTKHTCLRSNIFKYIDEFKNR